MLTKPVKIAIGVSVSVVVVSVVVVVVVVLLLTKKREAGCGACVCHPLYHGDRCMYKDPIHDNVEVWRLVDEASAESSDIIFESSLVGGVWIFTNEMYRMDIVPLGDTDELFVQVTNDNMIGIAYLRGGILYDQTIPMTLADPTTGNSREITLYRSE